MDPIFDAVLESEMAVAELLERSPGLSRMQVRRDDWSKPFLIGFTWAIHPCTWRLQPCEQPPRNSSSRAVRTRTPRTAEALHYSCDPRPRLGGIWNLKEQAKLIELLIKPGSKTEHVDCGGATALHRAVRARSPAAVRRLLKSGARVVAQLAKTGSTLCTSPFSPRVQVELQVRLASNLRLSQRFFNTKPTLLQRTFGAEPRSTGRQTSAFRRRYKDLQVNHSAGKWYG